MHALTLDGLDMRELTADELHAVSGGWSMLGAGLTLGGTLLGIAAIVVGTIGAPFWAVVAGAVAIGGAALAGLAYAADVYTEIQQSTPHGTVTIEELIPTSTTQNQALQESTTALYSSSDLSSAEAAGEADMSYIGSCDAAEFG